MNKGEVNIYNKDQAYYYIENGIKPIYTGVNKYKADMVYFKFNMDDTQEIYKKWCNQKQ